MSEKQTPTIRRRCAFYLGLGLFSLSERLQAGFLDDLAAKTMEAAQPSGDSKSASKTDPATILDAQPLEHWSRTENSAWKWFQREAFRDNQWIVTGITTPIHKSTGERYEGKTGYLDDGLIPPQLRSSDADFTDTYAEDGDGPGQPSEVRRTRHGRPPSKWLRSLDATELRIWLKRIDVPEAGVNGMSFWTHLTRDHLFEADRIEGLSEDEQAKLHAAAHYGY